MELYIVVVILFTDKFNLHSQLQKNIEKLSVKNYKITISVGVKKYQNSILETVVSANKALLSAKETGRNKVVIY